MGTDFWIKGRQAAMELGLDDGAQEKLNIFAIRTFTESDPYVAYPPSTYQSHIHVSMG